jgi:hypothetical protein
LNENGSSSKDIFEKLFKFKHPKKNFIYVHSLWVDPLAYILAQGETIKENIKFMYS